MLTDTGDRFALSFHTASIPGAPAGALVYLLELSEQDGRVAYRYLKRGVTGAQSTFGFVWPAWPYPGYQFFTLSPTTTYCARLTVLGWGDLARAPLQSNEVCVAPITVYGMWGQGTVPSDGGSPADAAALAAADGAMQPPDAGANGPPGGGGCGCATTEGLMWVAVVAFLPLLHRKRDPRHAISPLYGSESARCGD